jgi:hypothetical protein
MSSEKDQSTWPITASFGFWIPKTKLQESKGHTFCTRQELSFFEALICISVVAFEEDLDLRFYLQFGGDRIDLNESGDRILKKIQDYKASGVKMMSKMDLLIGSTSYSIIIINPAFQKGLTWFCQQLGLTYELSSIKVVPPYGYKSPKEYKEPTASLNFSLSDMSTTSVM